MAGPTPRYGDGSSAPEQALAQSPATLTRYDPADPAPNIDDGKRGGGTLRPEAGRAQGRRPGLLDPFLEKEIEVSGRVTVKLFASTSATGHRLLGSAHGRLPSGYSMHLTEGIIRGRYRKSLEKPELLKPGEVNEFAIDLWIVSNAFQRGHRIRLDVSSSSFPKYDRNPNTGNEFGQDSKLAGRRTEKSSTTAGTPRASLPARSRLPKAFIAGPA